jgi:S-formylglutathione hydrolase FrmB
MALLQCSFFSESLRISSSMNVILPQTARGQIGMAGSDSQDPPGVLYLLHGLSDDHSIWQRRTSIERYVANYPLAVVMPAVNRSFYADFGDNAYWTFISEELPQIVQSFFNVSNDWKKTFAAGLSMGGYGAFKLGLSHPERYAAVASLSGAVDIATPSSQRADLLDFEAIFGSLDELPGSNNDLFALVDKFPTSAKTKFYQCCGTADFLYQENLKFKAHAEQAGLDLMYEEHADETHNWNYWDQQIQKVLDWLPIERETA